MKGTLHKIERGWVVKQLIKEGPNAKLIYQYPLIDNGHIDGLMLYDSNEGQEVEFEIVDEIIDLGRHGSTVVEKAKLLDKWITMMEGDITVNFKPMPEFDDPKYPEVKIICPRCKTLMPCECNPPRQTSLLNSIRTNSSWDTIIKEFHIATQQVEKGFTPLIFECWLIENYNPPTKKTRLI
jgi:hypothetical protein